VLTCRLCYPVHHPLADGNPAELSNLNKDLVPSCKLREDKGGYSCMIPSSKETSLLGEGIPDQKHLYIQARGYLKGWCPFLEILS
jgi:hypothetical protein